MVTQNIKRDRVERFHTALSCNTCSMSQRQTKPVQLENDGHERVCLWKRSLVVVLTDTPRMRYVSVICQISASNIVDKHCYISM